MGSLVNWLTDKWSFSKASTVTKCPRKFFYKYVMKMKESSAPWLLFGRAVHDGQETDNYAKLRGERLTVKQVLGAAVNALENEDGSADLIDPFVKEHTRQLEAFEKSGERAKIVPMPGSVESKFELEVEVGDPEVGKTPATIEGYADVVSMDGMDGLTVVDYKTVGRPVSQREADSHIQLALESMGAEAGSAKIVSFVKENKQHSTTKVTAPVALTEARQERVLQYFADAIHAGRQAIKTGDFPKCDPGCYWCSATACDFYGLCYPSKQTDLHKFIEVKALRPAGSLPPEEWRESEAGRKEREKGNESQEA